MLHHLATRLTSAITNSFLFPILCGLYIVSIDGVYSSTVLVVRSFLTRMWKDMISEESYKPDTGNKNLFCVHVFLFMFFLCFALCYLHPSRSALQELANRHIYTKALWLVCTGRLAYVDKTRLLLYHFINLSLPIFKDSMTSFTEVNSVEASLKDVNLVIHVVCPLNGLQSIWVMICVVFGFLFQNRKFA